MRKPCFVHLISMALAANLLGPCAAARTFHNEVARTPNYVNAYEVSGWTSSLSLASSEDFGQVKGDKIACILRGTNIDAKTAKKAGEVFARAIRSMKFKPGELDKASLIHLLAQASKESGQFKLLTQTGGRKLASEKRGYGYIQVTGSYNRKAAAKCMAEADPGTDQGVVNHPESTIGKDPYLAALSSLCWWKKNMITGKNKQYAMLSGPGSSESVTRIVNGGNPHGKVTNGKKNIQERDRTFNIMMMMEPQCKSAG